MEQTKSEKIMMWRCGVCGDSVTWPSNVSPPVCKKCHNLMYCLDTLPPITIKETVKNKTYTIIEQADEFELWNKHCCLAYITGISDNNIHAIADTLNAYPETLRQRDKLLGVLKKQLAAASTNRFDILSAKIGPTPLEIVNYDLAWLKSAIHEIEGTNNE